MHARHTGQRGLALVAVMLVMAVFLVLASTLLFQSGAERLIAENEEDHVAALGYAEAALTWAERRVRDSTSLCDLLNGVNNGSTLDDNLLGLRNLSLTATSGFTAANEGTASAIITRDFGDGSKTWEVVRLGSTSAVRALVWVRIDDNYDDAPDNPTNNVPLVDRDNRVRVTAIAEYPVYVNALGVQTTATLDRGRAQRRLEAEFDGVAGCPMAITMDGDISVPSSMKLCGDCGSMHSNEDLTIGGSPTVCKNATASGSFTQGGATISGTKGGGFPIIQLPVITPYDNRLVPTIQTFNTSTDTALPLGLRCPVASTSDPGASKYFAFVSDGDKGLVYKAYWDFTNNRWMWKVIENLEGANTILDDCGRLSSDANYGLNDAGAVNDGTTDSFYGWKGSNLETQSCALCSSGSPDQSLCTTANNDFVRNGYYLYGGAWQAASSTVPILPGNFGTDNIGDFNPALTIKPGASKWDYSADTIYSPLYGAVIWVLGSPYISGNPGMTGAINVQCSGGAGCSSSTLPNGLWKLSLIAVGDIYISGQANLGPANTDTGYVYQLVAGRDIMISGNPQEDTVACSGTTCSYAAPSGIADMGGAYAAHESIQTSGNPNIFGFLLAEDAIDCSSTVTQPNEFNGNPNIFYDCMHPPNPWLATAVVDRLWWQEVD